MPHIWKEPSMRHVTSIGLDVHARSVTAAALNPITGEVTTKRFKNSPAEIAEWILGFESPKAVYESGVTGFYLVRALRELGVDCIVGAVSKMQRSAADKRKKNDLNDAVFLARLLSTNNIVEVMVPDEECEAMRDIARALEDVRDDLIRAKQRLTKFLLRHGYVFDETNAAGQRIGNWTHAHWEWIRKIKFSQMADEETFAYYISEVRHFEMHKKTIERYIKDHAKKERWAPRIEALRCLKGIEVMTAFAIVVEAQVFSRFCSASAFASWLGLVPSEHSSGERLCRGGITKAGNSHIRKLLVEASWHYARATATRKKDSWGTLVPLRIENHAAKGVKRLVERRRYLHTRGKKPVVANCATAREMACWIWAIGRMCEGTL
jgi:transposase